MFSMMTSVVRWSVECIADVHPGFRCRIADGNKEKSVEFNLMSILWRHHHRSLHRQYRGNSFYVIIS